MSLLLTPLAYHLKSRQAAPDRPKPNSDNSRPVELDGIILESSHRVVSGTVHRLSCADVEGEHERVRRLWRKQEYFVGCLAATATTGEWRELMMRV